MHIFVLVSILYNMENLLDFFANNFLEYVWVAVLLVSMIPTLESKIAIPLAMNTAIWGEMALSPFLSFLVATLGSIVPCYIVMFFTRYFKSKTTGFLHNKHFSKYITKSAKIENSKNKFSKYLGLACFTAVPLPLTGVWSASLIAGLTNLNIHLSFMSISIGAMISSAVITILCCLFNNSVGFILLASLILIVVFTVSNIMFTLFKSLKSKKMKQ